MLDLGHQPLANRLLREDDLGRPEPRYPLAVFACPRCWLLQITHEVPPAELFSDYVYFSSYSDAMVAHARASAQRHIRTLGLGADCFVIEVASNDGYLLKNFVRAGVPCLGVEPAANVAEVARGAGVETEVAFFDAALAGRLAASGRRADLVLGNNVFAHVPAVNDFVAGLAAVLKPGGRAVLEFPYAAELIGRVEFDTIYHEHVFYFSLTALHPLFARHGLEVIDVERLPIHGGSLRLTAARAGVHPVAPAVGALGAEEGSAGIDTGGYYAGFAGRVEALLEDLRGRLAALRAEGKTVAAYGASAKGSTLLNALGAGAGAIDFVADRSPHKHGRFTPGTHLPIVPADQLAARRPDYTLLLTWNFADEILTQQADYRRAGGKFIIPVPEVAVV